MFAIILILLFFGIEDCRYEDYSINPNNPDGRYISGYNNPDNWEENRTMKCKRCLVSKGCREGFAIHNPLAPKGAQCFCKMWKCGGGTGDGC